VTKPDLILIGAGLSGAAFLAHLLRDHRGLRGRVAVVEPSSRLGAGLAYGTEDPAHRVNVAAGRMSLFPDRPEHFLDWLAASGALARDPGARGADGTLHPRRIEFGAYVDDSLRAEIAASPVQVQHLRTAAIAVSRAGRGWQVALGGGATVDAPLLVLAVGHTAPDLPGVLAGLAGDPRLVADPWRPDALARIAADAPVLVVGTGLTGCDVIASLRLRGHRGPILAVSRRGLLPRPRTRLPVEAWGDFTDPVCATALSLLRRVRAAIAEAASLGRPWEDVIAQVRVQGGTVWRALPVHERRRLLRHLRPFWDVHRFQCAPQIDAVVREGLSAGWLSVTAATPVSAAPDGALLRVGLRSRGGGAGRETRTVAVAAIVNCTGPGHRSVVETHPVLHSLAAAGHLRADPCRLGIDVDLDSRVLDAAGRAWPGLFVAGPLARGTHGELMGLPQVALQPRAVAATVAALWPAESPRGTRDGPRGTRDGPRGTRDGPRGTRDG
jgi:uncharacterized NAD(P)/FAD-binding protein YdhS